jgi:hypothetical protein
MKTPHTPTAFCDGLHRINFARLTIQGTTGVPQVTFEEFHPGGAVKITMGDLGEALIRREEIAALAALFPVPSEREFGVIAPGRCVPDPILQRQRAKRIADELFRTLEQTGQFSEAAIEKRLLELL